MGMRVGRRKRLRPTARMVVPADDTGRAAKVGGMKSPICVSCDGENDGCHGDGGIGGDDIDEDDDGDYNDDGHDGEGDTGADDADDDENGDDSTRRRRQSRQHHDAVDSPHRHGRTCAAAAFRTQEGHTAGGVALAPRRAA